MEKEREKEGGGGVGDGVKMHREKKFRKQEIHILSDIQKRRERMREKVTNEIIKIKIKKSM